MIRYSNTPDKSPKVLYTDSPTSRVTTTSDLKGFNDEGTPNENFRNLQDLDADDANDN